ncbi:response regulator [Microvirga roseola]|uniref:response regulator n=1 Tax=Microvirga roseola TaxID=2883126 RepID=UPI001E424739|nr:response regulator [Microvirga roseola]
MHRLPISLRLSLLVACFALVFSGLAIAGAAFSRDAELFAAAAGIFLLATAGMPLLIGRQIRRALSEQPSEAAPTPAVEEVPLARAEPDLARLPVPSEPSPFENGRTLRRTQKAQAVDRLRDGITHDLNNRLMVISANIDAVARQVKDQPALQRKLLSALVASDQAAKLIAKSTAFARQHELQVQYVDLTERVNSVATLMGRSLLRDTVELRLSLEESLWPVEADPDDIETAIVTLSAHIRDALTQGGTISLEAQNMQVQKGSLSNLKLEGDFVRLVIRGTGAGEAVRSADPLSEQAFAIRDLDLSAWLNVSQSLHFLRSLGGASEVRHDGSDTAIILYLPRAKAATMLPSGSLGDDEALGADERGHTEILVVDDEVEVALALQSMLEEFGYVANVATDAGQAIQSLRTRKPGLVLTDVAMPGTMNGAMLAREVRQIFPDLPVLLITGSPVIAGEDSEFPLLQKPILSRDLHAAIQRHLTPSDDNKVVPLFPRAS